MLRILLSILSSTVILWPVTGHATPLKFGEFSCVPSLDEVFAFQLDQGKFRLNNVTLSEDKSWLAKNVIVLNVSASGSNRSEKNAYISVEVVGFDTTNSLVFAVDAEPMMSIIGPNKTEEIKGDIYASPGTLKKAKKICLRVNGEL